MWTDGCDMLTVMTCWLWWCRHRVLSSPSSSSWQCHQLQSVSCQWTFPPSRHRFINYFFIPAVWQRWLAFVLVTVATSHSS